MEILKFAAKVVLTGAPVIVCFHDVVGKLSVVTGSSMQPTLNSRDFVFLNCWAARRYQFQHGDVVSYVSPTNPEAHIVKRVVALEGETVRTLSYKNRLVTVPPGHCWVEGDNHARSEDSNCYGPIPVGLIYAKATHILWPPDRLRKLRPITESHRLIQHSQHEDSDDEIDAKFIDEILDMNVDINENENASVHRITFPVHRNR
ncbi:hypothetical protein CAPTEDRAFT_179580 [Capitella teleta]|uniref:Mitochondrial inner membrane protease subunit n=1 Tax=Capitella teleta TaxID=283909 RepID=R7TDQ2_CAPTE|nr:hypothetical protein CAPTEDRAFT_179580 [Capitella teleta]|eukprot:ELT89627.1 hypothetical protein CAPTEDRAFT_179580 [Capitella teleta]